MHRTIVQTETLALRLPAGGFALDSGEVLSEITLAFERYGTLAAGGDNAVFVCHALTGDAHAAFYHADDPKTVGWWDGLIGPGKGVDTNKFQVICCNLLGGCKGSTGPLSTNPATGQPYGMAFPVLSLRDTVRVEKLFLEQLGVTRLHAVIGGSLGGMRALLWAVLYPDFVERCVSIAASVHLSPQALAFDVIGRLEIENDPAFHGGDYQAIGTMPAKGLARARQIGHVTYLSSASMKARFGRRVHHQPLPGQRSKYATNFEVESYLTHQGQKFVDRFDAISYLAIMRMMDTFDLPADYGSVAAALAGVHSKFLIVSISSDWLFPPEQQLEIVTALIAQRKEVSYFQVQSDKGHDAFLLEYGVLNKGVRSFLEGRLPKHAPASVDRLDLERISPMIPPGTHLLDVGSGDGGLMVALARAKGITGVCLDREFEMVTQCMHRGLSAIQLDADTGMEMLPDNAFDCVLVNQTIQQLRSALGALRHLLRLAPTGVIGFPNFAYYEHRLALARDGRLPKSRSLPYEWYDSPNIHVVTIADFRDLCEHYQIRIEAMEYISDTELGRQLIASGDPNLGAERAVVRIARGPGLRLPGATGGDAAAATMTDDAPPLLHDSAT